MSATINIFARTKEDIELFDRLRAVLTPIQGNLANAEWYNLSFGQVELNLFVTEETRERCSKTTT